MQGKGALVKLNNLNHFRGQSTEISSVGFSEQFFTDRFLMSGLDKKLFYFKQEI